MIVLVTGGRTFGWLIIDKYTKYENREETIYLYNILNLLKPIMTKLVHGDAQGADSWAKYWAENNEVVQQAYPADWRRYDNAAGPIRNTQMLYDANPDIVLAFPGKTGTADMVRQSRKKVNPIPKVIICTPPNIPSELNSIILETNK